MKQSSDARTEPCVECTKPCPAPALMCGRCRLVYYCSKECQVAAWPRHRVFCVPPSATVEDEVPAELANCDTPVFRWLAALACIAREHGGFAIIELPKQRTAAGDLVYKALTTVFADPGTQAIIEKFDPRVYVPYAVGVLERGPYTMRALAIYREEHTDEERAAIRAGYISEFDGPFVKDRTYRRAKRTKLRISRATMYWDRKGGRHYTIDLAKADSPIKWHIC